MELNGCTKEREADMADANEPKGRIPPEARELFEELKRELTPEKLKEIEEQGQRILSGEEPSYGLEDLIRELEAKSRSPALPAPGLSGHGI